MDSRRPLVFLCGPAVANEKTDRRCALRGYILSTRKRINESNDKNYIHAYPIIIEDLLNLNNDSNNHSNIKINLLEEIIANISYKTYIFLDTLSTSYELGQFTNFAYNSNNTRILVDAEYENRINNSIGDYIKESFQGKFLKYPATYNNKGYIFFPKNRKGKCSLPKELIGLLEKDNPINSKEPFLARIFFSNDETDINKFGYIIYNHDVNCLTFNFNIKNLYYFISSVYRRINSSRVDNFLKEFPKSLKNKVFYRFIDIIKKELLTTFVITVKKSRDFSEFLDNNFNIKIKVGTFDSNELIYHILYMSHVLHNTKGKFDYVVPTNVRNREGASFPESEIDLLNIKNNHLNNLLKKYGCRVLNSGIQRKTLTIRNKVRRIICYSNNYEGKQLKYLHEQIYNSLLSVLPSSDSSFAYKKGRNAKECFYKHKGNKYFIKIDIHHFFESILLSRLKDKIASFIKSQCNKRFNKIWAYYSGSKNVLKNQISSIIKPLFYNYRLPIGFINSPKISDFYLYELDDKMSVINSVVYTRYADDILISSNNLNELENARDYLLRLIKEENLEINESKTKFGVLNNEGDSFKFLGINLVYRGDNVFEFSISKKYLVETSKMICSYLNNSCCTKRETLEKLIGRVMYIKSISEKSLNHLNKMIIIKTNNHLNLSKLLNMFICSINYNLI